MLTSDSNAPGRSLAVAAGTIYAVVDGEVAAVEAATGRRLWSHRPKLAGDAPHGKQQTVVVQGGGRARVQVFVGGNVAGAKPTSLTPPAVVGGELVFGSREGLHALDLKTRRELWRLKTEHPVVSRPVVVGGVVYFVTSDASRLGGLRIVRGAGAVAGSAKLRALRLRAEP